MAANPITIVPPDVDFRTSHPRGIRTIASIQKELERLAKRHNRLLPIDYNHHGGSSNNDNTRNNDINNDNSNNNNNKAKKKARKEYLALRHIKSDFHGNYSDEENNDDCVNDYYLSLFEEFAITVCHAKVIPRKELFEAWAMALYVNHYFPPPCDDDVDENVDENDCERGQHRYNRYQRVADLCSGQGLVSWAILFLDKSRSRTAVCIDISIPKACDIVEKVMLERHPYLATFEPQEKREKKEEAMPAVEVLPPPTTTITNPNISKPTRRRITNKRWHWIEGDICRNVSADSSTLIVGVHCCGGLSDSILDLAISSKSALALVPCCHTRKSLPVEYRSKSNKRFHDVLEQNVAKNNDILEKDGKTKQQKLLPTTLTDFIDRIRIQRLIDAGFEVQEECIPSVITPKNRIIIATPPRDDDDDDNIIIGNGFRGKEGGKGTDEDQTMDKPLEDAKVTVETKTATNNIRNKQAFTIPLADTLKARAIVESQSGRIAANLRLRMPAPNLSLSVYLPDPDHSLPEERLQAFADAIVGEEAHKYYPEASSNTAIAIIQTHVKFGAGPFRSPEDGRLSRAYRIGYWVSDGTGSLPQVTKRQAKELHGLICQRIEEGAFPGIELRQGIKMMTK